MSKSIQFKDSENEKIYPHPYYPIGSIFLSVNDTNPSTWFGGSWEQIAKGRTLVGVNKNDTDFNTVQKTGGSKTNSHRHVVGEPITTTDKTPGEGVVSEGNFTGVADISLLQPYFTCYIWCRIA